MDRIDTSTDVTRLGDETDPWDDFLEGRIQLGDLDPADQERARRFGLV